MVKRKNEPKAGSELQAKACLLCEKTIQGVQQLCGFCFKKIQSMKTSPPGSFDKGLIEAIQKSNARDRKSLAQKMITQQDPAYQSLKDRIKVLERRAKSNYVMSRKAMARKSTKAKLGFKQKTEKLTVKIDTSSS